MMKVIALFLTLTLLFTSTGISAGAQETEHELPDAFSSSDSEYEDTDNSSSSDSEYEDTDKSSSEPESDSNAAFSFKGGGALSAVGAIPAEMKVSDAIVIAVSKDNFKNYNLLNAEYILGLSAHVYKAGQAAGCFSVSGAFIEEGVVYFKLTATAITQGPASFSVVVKGFEAQSLSLVFSTDVISQPVTSTPQPAPANPAAPAAPENPALPTDPAPSEAVPGAGDDVAGAPEDTGVKAGPAYITDFSSYGSMPQPQQNNAAIQVGDSVMFLIPDDNFIWNTNNGVWNSEGATEKNYDLRALNSYKYTHVTAPANFSREFVAYGGALYLKLTATAAAYVYNEPVALLGEQYLLTVTVLDNRQNSPAAVLSAPPQKTDETKAGGTDNLGPSSGGYTSSSASSAAPSTSSAPSLYTPFAESAPVRTPAVEPAISVNPGGSNWVLESPANLSSTVTSPFVFRVPYDNFVATGGVTSGSLADINASVKITASNGINFVSANSTGLFSQGPAGANYFILKIKPDKTPVLIPNGTAVGFVGQPNKFVFTEVLYQSSSSGTNSSKAVGIAAGSVLGGANTWLTKNGRLCGESLDNLDALPGDEYLIHFMPGFFDWGDSTPPEKVLLSNISSNIKLRTSNAKNSKVMEEITLTTGPGREAVVRIKFKSPQIIRNTIEFSKHVYLYVKGSRHDDSYGYVAGEIRSDADSYYNDDDYIDLSDGTVGIAEEALRNVQVYIGNGVYINVRSIRKNSKFYGVATIDELDSRDEDILDEYPEIDYVYHLDTVGLNGAGNTVEIDGARGYYVYDEDLNYLGRGGGKLPYSEKYYLADRELDVPDDYDDDDYDYDYDDGDIPEDWLPNNNVDGLPYNGNYNAPTGFAR